MSRKSIRKTNKQHKLNEKNVCVYLGYNVDGSFYLPEKCSKNRFIMHINENVWDIDWIIQKNIKETFVDQW